LVVLIKNASSLLHKATGSVDTGGLHGGDEVHLTTLDAAKTIQYSKLVCNEIGVKDLDENGLSAALLLLHLEFVFDILENSRFHESVVLFGKSNDGFSASISDGSDLQAFLLQLSDELLQLFTFASHVLLEFGSHSRSNRVSILLPGGPVSIGYGALAKAVTCRCLDIIKSMQQLLDTPSFVAIFQVCL
jgi:hypothetical protein